MLKVLMINYWSSQMFLQNEDMSCLSYSACNLNIVYIALIKGALK